MKSIAFVLAAASLVGTGCISSSNSSPPPPCSQNVTIDWTAGFLGFDNVARGCAAANVASVDVFVNGSYDATFACSALSASASGLPSGTNTFTIEGIENGTGRIAFRAEASESGCGDFRLALQPGEGTLAVDYSFSPTNACSLPAPTYMWLGVYDDLALQTAFVVNGGTLTCDTVGAAPSYRLPAGAFTFDGIEEMRYLGGTSYGTLATDCTPRPFVIAGGAVTTVSPVLLDSVFACTAF